MSELLPCPFCGSNKLNNCLDHWRAVPYVLCRGCNRKVTGILNAEEWNSRAAPQQSEPAAHAIDGPDFLRISKSGYSLKLGWQEDKRIVARAPEGDAALEQWLKDAERLCDGWNAVQQSEPVREALDDMSEWSEITKAALAMLDRDILSNEEIINWVIREVIAALPLDAIQTEGKKEERVLVPVQPTPAMVAAGADHLMKTGYGYSEGAATKIYKLMLAAAQPEGERG